MRLPQRIPCRARMNTLSFAASQAGQANGKTSGRTQLNDDSVVREHATRRSRLYHTSYTTPSSCSRPLYPRVVDVEHTRPGRDSEAWYRQPEVRPSGSLPKQDHIESVKFGTISTNGTPRLVRRIPYSVQLLSSRKPHENSPRRSRRACVGLVYVVLLSTTVSHIHGAEHLVHLGNRRTNIEPGVPESFVGGFQRLLCLVVRHNLLRLSISDDVIEPMRGSQCGWCGCCTNID